MSRARSSGIVVLVLARRNDPPIQTGRRRALHGITAALATAILGLLPMPALAAAVGPPAVGGEEAATYRGQIGPRAAFEAKVLPTGVVTWIEVITKWSCRSSRYTRVKPFIADARPVPRIDRARRLRARDRYDNGRWDLRFSADWSRVSGTFTAAASGCKTATKRISVRRAVPKHTWQFGPYSGTTSQGLPISFQATSAVRYSRIESGLRQMSVSVRLECEGGTTIERVLRAPREDYVSYNGSFISLVNEGARLVAGSGEFEGGVEGTLAGNRATGAITVYGNSERNCSIPGTLSFTATR